jgi:hypothetical protein
MSGEIRAKTPHGEVSLDQLAGIQPGMARVMREVAERYAQAYHSAKGGNWKLAAYQMSQLRGAFRTAKVTRPKYSNDLDEFDKSFLVPVLRAIQARDWKAFEIAYEKGVEGSDNYHEKYGVGYIKYVLPEEPRMDLFLGPPEGFARKKSASEGD